MDHYLSMLQKECVAANGMMQKSIEQKVTLSVLVGICANDQWLRIYRSMIDGYGAWLSSSTGKR